MAKQPYLILVSILIFGFTSVQSLEASLLCQEETDSDKKLSEIYDETEPDYRSQALEITREQMDDQYRRVSRSNRQIFRRFRTAVDGSPWMIEAVKTEASMIESSESVLFAAAEMIREAEQKKLPIPVLTSISDAHDFYSGRLPRVQFSNIDELRTLAEKKGLAVGARATRLSNIVRASLEIAEKMPVGLSAKDDELQYTLTALTNPQAVYAFVENLEDPAPVFAQINEAVQKLYWIKGLKNSIARAEDGQKRAAELEALGGKDPNRFFDASLYPEAAAFLETVGAKPIDELPESVDLSAQFEVPTSQCLLNGVPTYACTAFAVVSDMETHTDVPQLSKGLPYGLAIANIQFYDRMAGLLQKEIEEIETLARWKGEREGWSEQQILDEIDRRANEDPDLVGRWNLTQNGWEGMAQIPLPDNLTQSLQRILSDEDYEKALQGRLSGTIPPVMMHILEERAAPVEEDFAWPRIFVDDYSQVTDSGYRIKSFATTQIAERDLQGLGPVRGMNEFDFYRVLMANQIPVSFSYDTDARFDVENWMYPVDKEEASSVGGHIINVVGYGVEADPVSGKPTPYLLVRDSLQPKPIHWRTPAHQILPRAYAVHRVTEVEKVESTKTEDQ